MKIIYCKPNDILSADYWAREGVFGTNVAVPINQFPIPQFTIQVQHPDD